MARAFIMQIDSSLCGCWGNGEAHVTDCLIGISKKFQTSCLRLRFWQRWTQQSGQVLSLGLASWALTHAMPFRACGCLGNALYEQQTWQPRHASFPARSRGLPFPRAIVSTYAWDPILSHLPKNVSKFIASFFFIFRFNPSCQHVNMFWSFPLKKNILTSFSHLRVVLVFTHKHQIVFCVRDLCSITHRLPPRTLSLTLNPMISPKRL